MNCVTVREVVCKTSKSKSNGNMKHAFCIQYYRHYITSHHLTSHQITSHHTHHIASHRIASHRIASHRIASHRIASHRIASHRIASHRIASHRIASHRIASHRITSHHIIEIINNTREGIKGKNGGRANSSLRKEISRFRWIFLLLTILPNKNIRNTIWNLLR